MLSKVLVSAPYALWFTQDTTALLERQAAEASEARASLAYHKSFRPN